MTLGAQITHTGKRGYSSFRFGGRFKTSHSYLRVNEAGFFPKNGLGVALFGVTPPFVKIVSVSMRFSFGIMRFSNTLFVELPLLKSMAKSH